MKKILFLCSAFLFIIQASAQVTINEYSAANLNEIKDNYGKTEDWIELYNDSDEEVDISGYHLSDKSSKPGKWEIPEGTVIPAKGFLVFWCSGRDEYCPGVYHTNFKLTQTKNNEMLLFTDPEENIINEVPVQLALVESSWCKGEDGGVEWFVTPNPTHGASNESSAKFQGYTEVPSMDMEAGFYEGEVTVTITNNSPGSTLRYTTNGTNPRESSPEYTEPITLTETTVLKAQSFSNDSTMLTGKMDFNTYFIDEDFSLAVFSVGANQVKQLANGNGDIIPIGSIEYFNLDKEREATSFGSLNRHGQDSWVLDHRSLDWVSRDEMGYSKAVNAQLFSNSDRDEYQKFMFRNSGDDNYPAINDAEHFGSAHIRDEYVQTLANEGGMKLDIRSVERVILFLNGEYWGVYGMRDRPVDHDYTSYNYDQGKYDTQFLTTWGSTEVQYGGQEALDEWYELRTFILENDMGDTTNYEKVEDEFNMLSLIDYMVANLNCVASDWLNYNTGWWRGKNPEGDHKKWGYILWDLDATFDYYINYSGVPDISPNAKPCDIDQISSFMDSFFFSDGGPGPGEVECSAQDTSNIVFEDCMSIIDGSSPYEATDSTFQSVVLENPSCCEMWDGSCQSLYDNILEVASCPSILNGSCPYPASDPVVQDVIGFFTTCCDEWGNTCEGAYNFFGGFGGNGNPSGENISVNGNVGMHEKIFLKLQEESDVFRQLYYSRQADLMNTVYSCENMLSTLDRMVAVIAPEMPRQIERWGGTMTEWESNVERLRGFIEERCEKFDDGLGECYNLTGPYQLTLLAEPDGVGEIDLNTLDIEEFPWTGEYFGNMDNKIKAKALDDDYEFSHWETRAGSVISPNVESRKAFITIETQDTLVAVFKEKGLTSTQNLTPSVNMSVYPNPSSGNLNVRYELDDAMDVRISLVNMLGQEVKVFNTGKLRKSEGVHVESLEIDNSVASSGMYFVKIKADKYEYTKKVSLIQ